MNAKRAGMCQLRDLLVTAPEPLRSELRALSEKQLLRRLAASRPELRRDPELRGSGLALRTVARRVLQLTTEERGLAREITTLVRALAPQLLDQPGVRPLLAAQVVLSWSHAAASAVPAAASTNPRSATFSDASAKAQPAAKPTAASKAPRPTALPTPRAPSRRDHLTNIEAALAHPAELALVPVNAALSVARRRLMDEREFFDRLAELAIRVGVNLRPDQDLVVLGDVEHSPLVRATMHAGWRAGASDVQCLYRDPYDRLFLGLHAAEARLERSPFATLALWDYLADGERAIIFLTGDATPDLYSDVDPARMARAVPREAFRRQADVFGRRGVARTMIPFPTEAWSARIFGEPDVARLREVFAHAMRLDEPDPPAAWRVHLAELSARAEMLTARSYDALRFRGPGTDLEIGLLPDAHWGDVTGETAWGQTYLANIPTEEVFTTPDCRRTHGVVTMTRPFADRGAYVTGMSLRFEHGRVVEASAREGEGWLHQMLATDDGSSMVGEIALVPAHNRLSDLNLTFFHGLFDENVSSHMALGNGITGVVRGSERLTVDERRAAGMSTSIVHHDFTIGGPEVKVSGVMKDGREEPLMADGIWQSVP